MMIFPHLDFKSIPHLLVAVIPKSDLISVQVLIIGKSLDIDSQHP
jgi:hypothetical protein